MGGAEYATATRAAPQRAEPDRAVRRSPASEGTAAFRLAVHVNEPGDEWEQEAERVADRVALAPAPNPPPPPSPPEPPPPPPTPPGSSPPEIQRCAACGRRDEELGVQRMCAECAAKADADARVGRYLSSLPGRGEQLPDATRTDLEPHIGVDLGAVRVHTGPAAAEAARLVDAHAFTHGPHISFAPGAYDPASTSGRWLLAHELTHVAQQRAAPPLRAASRSSPPTVQRQEKKEKGLLDQASDLLDEGADAVKKGFLTIVRKVAPGLADIIDQGPVAYLKGKITTALESWVSSLTGGIDVAGAVDSVRKSIATAWETVGKLMRGGADACKAVTDILGALRDLADAFFDNPAIDLLRTIVGKVGDVITTIIKVVGAPIFDALKDVLGTAWDVVKKIGSTIWSWIGKVRDAASWAWDAAAKALGLTGDSEDGVWAWIKSHALSIWESIKSAIAPVLGPITTVGKVLAALTPMGQIYIVVKYGPKVVEAVRWLWQHGFDADAAAKDPTVSKSILPQLISTAKGFGASIESAATWVVEQAQSLATAVLELGGRITGVPLLGMAKSLVSSVAEAADSLLEWGRGVLKSIADGVQDAVHKVVEVVEPWKEVISSVIMAIVDPPMIPVILAGWAWRKLSSCVRRALIDFILDIVIKALRSMVDLDFFGPLWALLKAGVIGFLTRLRTMADDVKEAVSNKVAKIMSGASPAFMLGFVGGFLKGVWQGISDPISLLWSILDGITSAVDALMDAASRFLAPAGAVAAPAVAAPEAPAAPAAAPAPTATPTPAPAPASTVPAPVAAPASPASAQAPTAPAPAAAAPAPAASPISPVAAPAPAGAAPAPAASPQGGEQRSGVVDLLLAMGRDLAAPFTEVTSNFWAAVSEYFSSGGTTSFGDLIDKLGGAWNQLKTSLESAGGSLAEKIVGFLQGEGAEGEMGEAVGWVSGQISFQALLDFFTAGTWSVASPVIMELKPVITVIAKVINWPMEVMGEAMSLLKKVGGFVVDGIKGLAGMAKEAAAGALKTVVEAIETIGEKLLQWGEEIGGKLGAGEKGMLETAGAEAKTVEADVAKAAESDVAKSVEAGGAEKTEQEIADEAKRKAEQDAAKQEESAAEKEEQKAAEHAEAEAMADAVIEESDFEHDRYVTTLAKLYALVKTRFTWIESFEMKAEGGGEMYYMIASETPLKKRKKEDETSFADVSADLGLEPPGTVKYRSSAKAAKGAEEAELLGEEEVGFQTHSSKRTVQKALGMPLGTESAHVVPQAVYRQLQDLGMNVSEGKALTLLVPREVNSAIDAGWKAEWGAAMRAGREVTAGEVYGMVSRSIEGAPSYLMKQLTSAGYTTEEALAYIERYMNPDVQGALRSRLGSELFSEIGLDAKSVVLKAP